MERGAIQRRMPLPIRNPILEKREARKKIIKKTGKLSDGTVNGKDDR